MSVTDPPGSAPHTFDDRLAFTRESMLNGLPVRSEQTLRDVAQRVARRRWLLFSIATSVFGAVSIWAFTATPRYRSEARLRIESKSSSSIPSIGDQIGSSIPGASLLGLNRDELETEVGVLRSDRIADAMIDSLALGVRVTKPAASRAQILSARVADPALDADGKLTLKRQAGGRYAVTKEKLDDVASIPPVMTPGMPVQIGGTIITLAPTLVGAGPDEIVVRLLPRYQVHKLLDKRLIISRQEGGSRLVEVSYEDPDRVLATQVVTNLVGEYVKYTTITERTEDTTTVAQLRMEVDSTSRRLAAAEQALRAFEERSRLIAPEEQATAQIKRLSTISTHVDAISVERNALARTLTIIDQKSRGGAGAAAYRQLATFPSLITNRAIQDLLQALVDLENKRSLLGVRRTENNDEYKQLSDRIAEIEKQLYQLGPQYLESLDQQLATTANAVTALTDTLQAMPAAAMQYGRLVRDRTLLEATYLALQKQLKQAQLKDVLRQQRVRVVDVPRVANRENPAFPRKAVMLALGLVLGIALALSVGLAVELWRDPAQPAI
ncbi:MAG TPA: GNVR domain-containing protein [Gemmatimonadaceae bacterium]